MTMSNLNNQSMHECYEYNSNNSTDDSDAKQNHPKNNDNNNNNNNNNINNYNNSGIPEKEYDNDNKVPNDIVLVIDGEHSKDEEKTWTIEVANQLYQVHKCSSACTCCKQMKNKDSYLWIKKELPAEEKWQYVVHRCPNCLINDRIDAIQSDNTYMWVLLQMDKTKLNTWCVVRKCAWHIDYKGKHYECTATNNLQQHQRAFGHLWVCPLEKQIAQPSSPSQKSLKQTKCPKNNKRFNCTTFGKQYCYHYSPCDSKSQAGKQGSWLAAMQYTNAGNWLGRPDNEDYGRLLDPEFHSIIPLKKTHKFDQQFPVRPVESTYSSFNHERESETLRRVRIEQINNTTNNNNASNISIDVDYSGSQQVGDSFINNVLH